MLALQRVYAGIAVWKLLCCRRAAIVIGETRWNPLLSMSILCLFASSAIKSNHLPNIGHYIYLLWENLSSPQCHSSSTALTSTKEASGTTRALPVLWPRLVASRASRRQKRRSWMFRRQLTYALPVVDQWTCLNLFNHLWADMLACCRTPLAPAYRWIKPVVQRGGGDRWIWWINWCNK